MDHTGAGFVEVVHDLAQQYGLQVPEDERSPQERARAAQETEKRHTLTDVLARAGEGYKKHLKDSPRAVDYLKKRGLSGQVARDFGLGYAPEGWRTLASVFPDYADPLLDESGLVIVGEDDPSTGSGQAKRYDRFRDRIMFPIRSVKGEVNDAVICAVVSPRQQKMNQGAIYTDYGGQVDKTLPNIVTRGAGDLGMTVGALGFFPAMDVVRQALPMVLTMLKMALVICIPLVLLLGTYDLKTAVTVSCVQFALFFVDFWFQLARWIDSTLLDALYGRGFGADRPHTNFDPLIGLNNAFGDMLLNFVMAMMFIVLPTFWVMALAWAGVRTGNIVQGLSTATSDAKGAGGRGAGMAMSAVSKK